jgi:hypothetical protein
MGGAITRMESCWQRIMPETAWLVTPFKAFSTVSVMPGSGLGGENFWCQIIVQNIKKLENI